MMLYDTIEQVFLEMSSKVLLYVNEYYVQYIAAQHEAKRGIRASIIFLVMKIVNYCHVSYGSIFVLGRIKKCFMTLLYSYEIKLKLQLPRVEIRSSKKHGHFMCR